MTSESTPTNTYTDNVKLNPHWLTGSLQLLGWLLCHPSAWRNQIARIDPVLGIDFTLLDLEPEHWHNRDLRQILLQGYIIWPLLVGLIVALALWIFGASGLIAENVLAGTAYALAAGVAVGLTVGVAMGLVYGLFIGLLVGIALPLLGGTAHSLIYAAAAGLAGSVLLGLVHRRGAGYLRGKQVAGIVLALLASALLVGVIYNVVSGQFLNKPGVASVDEPVGLFFSMILGMIGVVLYGAVYGLLVWRRSENWQRAIVIGLIVGLAGGLSYGTLMRVSSDQHLVLHNVSAGLAGGLLFAGLFALPYLLAKHLAGVWAGAIVGALIGGASWIPLAPFIFGEEMPPWPDQLRVSLIVIGLGLTLIWWRPILFYPLELLANLLLYRRDKQRPTKGPSLLRFHSAFWDELQWLSLVGLDQHLVLVAERSPDEGQAAINYLATSRQSWAARAAQVELFARQLEQCTDIECLQNAHRLLTTGELNGPANPLLNSFSRYSQDVKAAMSQATAYHKRLALNEVGDRLNSLVRELNLANDPYAKRFQPIAIQWWQVVVNHLDFLARTIEHSQEIDNPYIFSSPLSEKQGVFVGRIDVVTRIEQFLRDPRRPPLLLYGQRRMGKTSLLRNLGRLLPSTIVPLFVDGQGASLADNYADYLYSVAKQMVKSAGEQRQLALPPLPREKLSTSPFITFNDWLDEVEQVLETHDKSMALLTLDELEALARVTDKERFDAADLLSLLRNLIQHRSRFKVMLAGSRTLEEFDHWASHLINMQVLKIGYLENNEALHLIENPIPNFSLRYELEASQRILKLTRGHPHLIQLLCHEIVILKNKQPPAQRRLVGPVDVEAAVSSALDVGYLFFADIRQNQIDETGSALLRFMAAQGEDVPVSQEVLADQFSIDLDQTLSQLLHRDLIEPVQGGYRFQVEMVRCWFDQQYD
jgi:hypothetical protein